MFDIDTAVKWQEQLKQDATRGLPERKKDYQEPVLHVSDELCEGQVIQEGTAISKAFKSKTMGFGKRLRRVYKQGGDTFPTGFNHRAIGRNY